MAIITKAAPFDLVGSCARRLDRDCIVRDKAVEAVKIEVSFGRCMDQGHPGEADAAFEIQYDFIRSFR